VSLLVKICGLTDQRHVQHAVAAGADAVGFVFARSVRQVTPRQARTISKGVPAGVRRVAVMLHPGNEEWQQVLDGFAPDVLQTDAADFDALDVPNSVERWPVFRQGVSTPGRDVTTYLFEGARSGQGETVDWSNAATLARHGNMILAGGLAASNVAEAIATVKPFGVDVSSAVESAPGRKDSRLISEFIDAARAAETFL
jgi:phosphoribosylanthranilate isomerase